MIPKANQINTTPRIETSTNAATAGNFLGIQGLLTSPRSSAFSGTVQPTMADPGITPIDLSNATPVAIASIESRHNMLVSVNTTAQTAKQTVITHLLNSGYTPTYANKMADKVANVIYENAREAIQQEQPPATHETVLGMLINNPEEQGKVIAQFQTNFGSGENTRISKELTASGIVAPNVTGLSQDKLERMEKLLLHSPFVSRLSSGNIDHLYSVAMNIAAKMVQEQHGAPLTQEAFDNLIFQTFATDLDLKGCNPLIRQAADYLPLTKHDPIREQNLANMTINPFPGSIIGHGLTSFETTHEFARLFYGNQLPKHEISNKAILGFLAKVIHHPTDFPATFLKMANIKPDFLGEGSEQAGSEKIGAQYPALPNMIDRLYTHALSGQHEQVNTLLGEIKSTYPALTNTVHQFYCDDMGQLQPSAEGGIQAKWVGIKMGDIASGFNRTIVDSDNQNAFNTLFAAPAPNTTEPKQGKQLIEHIKANQAKGDAHGEPLNIGQLKAVLVSSFQTALVDKLKSYVHLSSGHLSSEMLQKPIEQLRTCLPENYNRELCRLIKENNFSGKEITLLNSVGTFCKAQQVMYDGITLNLPAIAPTDLLQKISAL